MKFLLHSVIKWTTPGSPRRRCSIWRFRTADAAGLIVFDDEFAAYVRPSTRQGQAGRLLSGLEQAEPRARTDSPSRSTISSISAAGRGIVVSSLTFTNLPNKSSGRSSPCASTEMKWFYLFLDPKEIDPISASRPRSSIWKPGRVEITPEYVRDEYRKKWAAH